MARRNESEVRRAYYYTLTSYICFKDTLSSTLQIIYYKRSHVDSPTSLPLSISLPYRN